MVLLDQWVAWMYRQRRSSPWILTLCIRKLAGVGAANVRRRRAGVDFAVAFLPRAVFRNEKLEVIGNIMRPSRKFIGRCVGVSGRRAALSETSDRRTTTWSRIGREVAKQNERFRPAVDRLLSSRSRVQLTLQHQSNPMPNGVASLLRARN